MSPSEIKQRPSGNLDAFIFGGGLAGTILADHLRKAGKRILIIDDPEKSRCSRVAAGLINPIGGKRLKLVWQADTFIPHAVAYYRALNETTGRRYFHRRAIARFFANSDEAKRWEKRIEDPGYQRLVSPIPEDLLPASFGDPRDGFLISDAGYLDTKLIVDTLRAEAISRNEVLSSVFNYDEIVANPDCVRFRGYQADRAIFAEGFLGKDNPWFPFVPHRPAKGVIGTIRLHRPLPANTIFLKSKFLIPRHDGLFCVGATYRWGDYDPQPDSDSIQELESFLDAHLPDQWEWVEYAAGIRPTIAGAYPVVGPLPDNPRIISFNGFGSKGSMQIPYLAKVLVEYLYQQSPLPKEVLPERFIKKTTPTLKRWVATDIARRQVEHRLRPGDIAIDATAGNGHDTTWLCQAVGQNGRVFAFDIQEEAIANTAEKLGELGLSGRATLFQQSHDTMATALPPASHGAVSAIVFNLGYLPGGDRSIITQATTTLAAFNVGLGLLKPAGILCAVLYPAHPGGEREVRRILEWSKGLSPHRYQTEIIEHPTRNPASPFIITVVKRKAATPAT